ncbi:hypothetical protein H5410_021291 [Solanum commersonii]|uniref:Uncharacterized protein n=1 Tax=Solanum commersonii TaxID=4109 RepID=A0A9J5ZBJ6_SOLCO|nr:hypothetical protein H5410_021291 [Solanum commersonii]
MSISRFQKICVAADHLTLLVEIADQLGDPPFDRFHRRLALSFSIVVFRLLGDIVALRGTARQYIDCSFSPPIWSFPSGLSMLEQKARIRPFWRFAEWVW